jgi:geranylgeranyl diphosphate synthase type I
VLTLLCSEACDGDRDDALPAAVAVELLHNFSLIHDDIQDRDELRRGRPTLWKLWGVAQAINAGDAMFAMAHLAIERLRERDVPATRIIKALRIFDETSIALTVGQHLDLSFETRADVSVNEYMTMIQGKTGALIHAACAIGAITAGAPAERVDALGNFGAWLGIAFQLQDDVLGIWGDPDRTGKQDSDLRHRKKTMPVLYAAEKNQQVRDMYFNQQRLSDDDLLVLKGLIEDCDGRSYTEQAALDAYTRSLDALDAAHGSGAARQALHDLARQLLGRDY